MNQKGAIQNYREYVMGLPDDEWVIRAQAGVQCMHFRQCTLGKECHLVRIPVICSSNWFGFLATFHSQPCSKKF